MDLSKVGGVGDIMDAAKDKVTDMVTENIAEKAVDMVEDKIEAAEALADKVGLGDMFDKAVDAAEDKLNVDIDGDGDKGVL